MTSDRHDTELLLGRALGGDCGALADLFERHRGRLEQMVRVRLDRRLQGRLDPADVLQDAYLDVARRFKEYAADPALPFFLWLRLLAGQRLVDLHRHHLGAKMRDAGREVALGQGRVPQGAGANHASLPPNPQAGAPCDAFAQDGDPDGATDLERWSAFHEAVERLPAEEREVVSLAFYHGWTQAEIGELFGVEERTVSRRWRAACLKLHEALKDGPPELAEKGDAN